jgi:deazaflavin-dependent oxidoreductase (nitroreductase family)
MQIRRTSTITIDPDPDLTATPDTLREVYQRPSPICYNDGAPHQPITFLAESHTGGETHLPNIEESPMAEYIPSPRDWVRDQVELYERSGGTEGITLRDTGLPVIIVTHTGNKTGAIRKTPLMRVKDGANYVLVGSQGGAPTHPVWVYNLRANPAVEIRDLAVVQSMRVREVEDAAERTRLWDLAVAAYPPYAEYQTRTTRRIPLFVAEPAR